MQEQTTKATNEMGIQVDVHAKEDPMILLMREQIKALIRQLSVKVSVTTYILKSEEAAKRLTGLSEEQRNLFWNFFGGAKSLVQLWKVKIGKTSKSKTSKDISCLCCLLPQ